MAARSSQPETAAADRPPPTAGVALATLKQRREFLACSRARKWVAPGLIVQGRARGPEDQGPPRVGFTCSKKLGKAVTRNRAKRRLREVARQALAPRARRGWDYVLVGRPEATVSRPFPSLLADVVTAVERLHRPAKPKPKPKPRPTERPAAEAPAR
ncbi:MAG: ribonuclease P protein component [Pikeienuella sp.]